MSDPTERQRHLDELRARTAWLEAALELARSGLDAELAGARTELGDGCSFEEDEPEPHDMHVHIDTVLMPEVDRALRVYDAGGSQVEVYNWHVSGIGLNVSIVVTPDVGVVIDSTMRWFMRRLYFRYTGEGYTVVALNEQDDEFMMHPTRVRIFRDH